MSFIEEGLVDLVKQIKERDIKSVAIPPLGSGLGGLNWDKVKEKIITALKDIENLDVVIYEPRR
jgi:O-acetyl-ADP-ribose deacetylase (regulator of RNase III)